MYNNNKISVVNASLFATAPVFAVYSLWGLTSTFFLIWIVVILNIIAGDKIIVGNRKAEFSFFIAIIIIGFIGFLINISELYFSSKLYFNNLFSIFSFFVPLVLCTKQINKDFFKKIVIYLGLLAAAICIFQRLQFIATGSYLNEFFIPGLEVKRDIETFSYGRPSAFFTEPAHLSIYLLPVFYLLLIENKKLLSIIVGGGILACGSTTGFLLLFVVYLLSNFGSGVKIFHLLFGLMIIVLLYVLLLYYSPDILISNYEKLQATDTEASRLLGPLDYLKYFDEFQLIFGVGINQLSSFLHSHGFVLTNIYGEEMDMNYANAILYMVLSYGILGGGALLIFLIRIFKKYNCKFNIGFYIILISILMSDQVLFNMNFLYLLVFVIIFCKDSRRVIE